MTTITMLTIESPLGALRLFASSDELLGVYLAEQMVPATVEHDARAVPTPVLDRAAAQLAEYFGGERRTFDLPIGPRGTGFQQIVWQALTAIPFGVTHSYGTLARAIGRPAASRAVGMANSK